MEPVDADACTGQSADITASCEVLILGIRYLDPTLRHQELEVPPNATVDDLIAKLRVPKGCVGFLATACQDDDDTSQYDDFDYDEAPETASSGLAEKLSASGGILLEPGQTLSSYGVDATSSAEVRLYPMYAEEDKQPLVFEKDLKEMGFGESVRKFVKLNPEDKELVAARHYFVAPLFPWLQQGEAGEAGLSQTVEFSMDDNFIVNEPHQMLTVHVAAEGDGLQVSCTNMAGDSMCSVKLCSDDTMATLRSCLCDELQWASIAFWDGPTRVPESTEVSRYSLLTGQQSIGIEQISGCYERHKFNLHPAGYSASSTSLTDILILESGKAGLLHHFAGDYKRAQELNKMVMADARWSVEPHESGENVVKIAGRAQLHRHWVHERCGPDGESLHGYECYALVTIPLQQLLRAQSAEEHRAQSTEGSGWTCGSEDYKCAFFLPMCLVNALRVKADTEEDEFVLRHSLNRLGAPDYPYSQMAFSRRGRRGDGLLRIPRHILDMIKHFRENISDKAHVGVEEILQLQVTAPRTVAQENAPANSDDEEDE